MTWIHVGSRRPWIEAPPWVAPPTLVTSRNVERRLLSRPLSTSTVIGGSISAGCGTVVASGEQLAHSGEPRPRRRKTYCETDCFCDGHLRLQFLVAGPPPTAVVKLRRNATAGAGALTCLGVEASLWS